MRLGWTTSKYSITYRAVKTIRINGKNKTQIVKSFGSEKQICETYGVRYVVPSPHDILSNMT